MTEQFIHRNGEPDPPTMPGYYWRWAVWMEEWEIVEVTAGGHIRLMCDERETLRTTDLELAPWVGPIVPPAQPAMPHK